MQKVQSVSDHFALMDRDDAMMSLFAIMFGDRLAPVSQLAG
jgi:hypothetical protein